MVKEIRKGAEELVTREWLFEARRVGSGRLGRG